MLGVTQHFGLQFEVLIYPPLFIDIRWESMRRSWPSIQPADTFLGSAERTWAHWHILIGAAIPILISVMPVFSHSYYINAIWLTFASSVKLKLPIVFSWWIIAMLCVELCVTSFPSSIACWLSIMPRVIRTGNPEQIRQSVASPYGTQCVDCWLLNTGIFLKDGIWNWVD